MDSPPTAPSLALAAFSEDLITGRRVVVFGNALSGLAETLVERGARLIHVYDEDPARVAEAAARSSHTSVSFAPLAPGGIAVRDGAFDVGFVEEVATFSDPAQLITRLRRALSARGVGFVCTANAEVSPLWRPVEAAPSTGHLSYYELYDLVSTQFDEIRMVGQTPFAGYALADFSPDTESEFSIDTGFVPGGAEEPERYVAVCSHFPISIEPFCVVQMVAAALVGRGLESAAVAAPIEPHPSSAVLSQIADLRDELTTERAAKNKLEQLLRDVNEELSRRDEWVTELESRASTADARADAAEAALEELAAQQLAAQQLAAQQLSAQQLAAQQLAAQKERARAEEQRAPRESDTERQLRDRERKLEEVNRLLADQQEQLASGAQEFAANARQLAARTEQLTQLEHQVAELRRTLALVEQAKANAETGRDEARAKLAELERGAAVHALAESQVAELQMTVAELRAQVATLRSDLQLAGEEIARAEQQLSEQGQIVRQLRANLTETERFAEVLLAQREDEVQSGVSAPAPFEPDIPSEVTFQSIIPTLVLETESVDEVPSLAGSSLSERVAADVVPASTPGDERRALADARAREAELEATLQATRWTVDELETRLAQKSNEQELLERLYRAEHQLQRQATLIAQYESQPRVTPAGVD